MDTRTYKKIAKSVKAQASCPSHQNALMAIATDLYTIGVPSAKTGEIAQRMYKLAEAAAGDTDYTSLIPSQPGFYAHAGQVMWVYLNTDQAHHLATRALRSFAARQSN